jgi:hypothetical protein
MSVMGRGFYVGLRGRYKWEGTVLDGLLWGEVSLSSIINLGDMMASRRKVALLGSALGLVVGVLIAAAPPTFRNVKARDAKVVYDEEMRKAEVEYIAKSLAAKRNYRVRLEQGKIIATQAGDLDDANKIVAELKKVDQEIKEFKDGPPAGVSRGLVIRKASHGIGDKWADVTDAVRNKISNELLNLDGLPDPAPGESKTIVVEGLYGGREFVLSFNDAGGDPRKTFVFGMPSENVKIAR